MQMTHESKVYRRYWIIYSSCNFYVLNIESLHSDMQNLFLLVRINGAQMHMNELVSA